MRHRSIFRNFAAGVARICRFRPPTLTGRRRSVIFGPLPGIIAGGQPHSPAPLPATHSHERRIGAHANSSILFAHKALVIILLYLQPTFS